MDLALTDQGGVGILRKENDEGTGRHLRPAIRLVSEESDIILGVVGSVCDATISGRLPAVLFGARNDVLNINVFAMGLQISLGAGATRGPC